MPELPPIGLPAESELLAAIAVRAAGEGGVGVIVGPGDDCAVVSASLPSGGPGLLVVGVDQLVEGRHFTPDTPIDLIARKAVGRAVSDLAAMAATPAWALATALYDPADPRIAELAGAVHRWGRAWGCPVVGGDLASWGPGGAGGRGRGSPLVLTVTAAGFVPDSTPPVALRSSARPGDGVWVTGRFGGSLASGRHLHVTPRVVEALALRASLGADLHGMIDVSDGLGLDAHRIATASGVRIEIDARAVPRHEGVADWRNALADGEDYELCFTSPRADLDRPEGWPEDVELTRIGRVVATPEGASPGAVVVDPAGVEHAAGTLGWDHGVR